MLLSEFINEIHTDFSSYSDSGDIDNNSIKLWVIYCLRQLGLNVCEIEEDIVKVSNSQALLKESFRALKLALLLTPIECEGNTYLQTNNYVRRQRIENPAYYDTFSGEYITTCDSKIVTEITTVGDSRYDYFSHEPLSLVKGIDKKLFSADCLNIHPSVRDKYPNKISITGNTLYTNFREGEVYLQFYTLPNIDGELVIPELTTLDILQWITVYVKKKIAENIIANNKGGQGLLQLYAEWAQMLIPLKSAASKEAKAHALPKDWHKKYNRLLKAETAKYYIHRL